jgi:hypothetical protein
MTDPALIKADKLVYLSNAMCEFVASKEAESLLKAAGLSFREEGGEFIPFSEDEERYLTDETLPDLADGYGVMLGYTVLCEGRKWFAPTTEFYFGGSASQAADAEQTARALVDALGEKIVAVGGAVILEINALPDRHVVTSVVPFEHAAKVARSREEWVRYLETDLLDDGLSVQSAPSI